MGLGGHSQVVIEALTSSNHQLIGYFDKKVNETTNLKYLGRENSKIQGYNIFISIGENTLRMNVYKMLNKNNNLNFSIMSPRAYISPNVVLHHQCFVAPGSIINPNTIVGIGSIINSNAIVEHDTKIGEFTHIAPGATICGGVFVGFNCLIGANSTVLPGIKIGNNVTIGAGSVVTKNLESNSVFIGNPLKKIK